MSSLEDAFKPIAISGPNSVFIPGVVGGVMPGTQETARAPSHNGSSSAFMPGVIGGVMPGTQTRGKMNCIDGKTKYGLAMQGGMICRQREEEIYRHEPVREPKAGRDGKY